MSKRILAIGKNSMLARWWRASEHRNPSVSFAHHGDIGNDRLLDGIATVVSFCRPAEYDRAPVAPDDDPNARIAAWLAAHSCRLVMLSSSKVYAPLRRALVETDALNANSIGARNRVRSEQAAFDRLGDRLTVLRCSNIIGYELDKGRPTFMAILLRNLRDKGIVEFNCRPDARRDFLPDVCFLEYLERVADNPLPGVFNLGSGIPLRMSDVAEWVIEGHGAGRIVQTADKVLPDAIFSTAKLTVAYGVSASLPRLRDRCKSLGRQLRDDSRSAGA